MKRFQLLVMVSMITAGAIWFGFYRAAHTSATAVTNLLPKDTLALVHMPDFQRFRKELHQTDLYQIWKEPAVQEFLRKPRAKIATNQRPEHFLQQCEALQVKDAFLALVTIEQSAWKIVAGFRFKADKKTAEDMVASWKAKLLPNGSDSNRETSDYYGREIKVDGQGMFRIATVQDGPWFFIANDPDLLRPLLDRVDGRAKDSDNTLTADETFSGAFKRMPSIYMALAFGKIDRLVEKLTPLVGDEGKQPANGLGALRQVHSLCAATSFDAGKIRDTIFATMPRLLDAGDLTRLSLPIASKDSFLYAATLVNLTKPLPLPTQDVIGWAAGLQHIARTLSLKGITLQSWNSAFGPEISWIGDWPANARWPSAFLTLPVKNASEAGKILEVIATDSDDSISWNQNTKDGIRYFSTRFGGQFLALSPTIALSDRLLVAGADMGSVEAAMRRAADGKLELANTRIFRTAESLVPPAKQAFSYLDSALIYTRLDATIRPILLWSGAFLPSVADTLDINKLPPPETITKHLSPIVMSQSYDVDGYLAESVGPITIWETIAGLATAGTLVATLYERQTHTQMAGNGNPTNTSWIDRTRPDFTSPAADTSAE